MKKKYQNFYELIRKELSIEEYDNTKNVINFVSDVKRKGFFNKEQFVKMAFWKSPRPKKWYESNDDNLVIKISGQALASDAEEEKANYLTILKGVSIPTASAILTLIDPQNYGVMDIRVWQLMYLYDEVDNKPGGKGFSVDDWVKYLSVLRKYSKEFKVKTRDVERILFEHHKDIQEGNLYS